MLHPYIPFRSGTVAFVFMDDVTANLHLIIFISISKGLLLNQIHASNIALDFWPNAMNWLLKLDPKHVPMSGSYFSLKFAMSRCNCWVELSVSSKALLLEAHWKSIASRSISFAERGLARTQFATSYHPIKCNMNQALIYRSDFIVP